MMLSQSLADMCRVAKNLSHSVCSVLAEVEQGDGLPYCVSSCTANKGPFRGHGRCTLFSAFLCFLLVISLFRMALKHSAEMLPIVPKFKEAVMGLQRKA